jgi:hypothetical protein
MTANFVATLSTLIPTCHILRMFKIVYKTDH